jgi:hypothetical protein
VLLSIAGELEANTRGEFDYDTLTESGSGPYLNAGPEGLAIPKPQVCRVGADN